MEDSVLLIEDDLVDVLIFKRAMQALEIDNTLLVARSGEEALNILSKQIANSLPSLIFLDLNMSGMGGIALLNQVKQHVVWRRIPVIILTTSDREQERCQCFDLSAAGFIVKPLDFNHFVGVMHSVYSYWRISALAI